MVRQRRSGLVHDDHPGVLVDHAGDLHHLLLGGGQVAGHVRGPDDGVHLHLLQQLQRPRVHAAVVQEHAVGFFLAQEDVLRHGQVLGNAQLLMDDRDALVHGVPGALEFNLFSVQEDIALRGGVDTGEDLDQRGFTGAVFAHQGVHLSGVEIHRYVRQGSDARKDLGYMNCLQAGLHIRHPFTVIPFGMCRKGARRGHVPCRTPYGIVCVPLSGAMDHRMDYSGFTALEASTR